MQRYFHLLKCHVKYLPVQPRILNFKRFFKQLYVIVIQVTYISPDSLGLLDIMNYRVIANSTFLISTPINTEIIYKTAIEVNLLLQDTPTSSLCVQSLTPQPRLSQ